MATHTTHTGSHKYKPLTEFLRRQSRAVVRMSFDEIEHVIGAKLPPSATQHRAWWSNNARNNVTTTAWKDVDLTQPADPEWAAYGDRTWADRK